VSEAIAGNSENKKKPTTVLIWFKVIMQSHYTHVFQEHLFQMQAKLLMMHVAFVTVMH